MYPKVKLCGTFDLSNKALGIAQIGKEQMATYKLGDVVKVHDNFDYETNCALCAKPLGANFVELMTGDNNNLITADEYKARMDRGAFAATLPIGSTCVKRVAAEAVVAA